MAFDVSVLTSDFGDAVAEANACRNDCALFDFSFLECAQITGKGSRSVVEAFAGRPLVQLQQNAIAYAVRVNAVGHAVSDLTVWRTDVETFEVMSGRRQDITDLLAAKTPGITVTNKFANRAVFSVQGPGTLDSLRKIGCVDVIRQLRYYTFAQAHLAGIPCVVGRLGYTGEAGFEIVFDRSQAERLWQEISQHVRPAGFIAADALRIESGFVLFANEFLVPATPGEAGLGKFHPNATPIGGAIRLISFRADTDRLTMPWRPAAALRRPADAGTVVVTSACFSTAAGSILGLGYVQDRQPLLTSWRDPTGTFRNIHTEATPFFDSAKQRPRAPWR